MSVNLGIDRSGKNNHWTVTGATTAVDQMLDSPTNNFCTMNPLDNISSTYSEGNTKVAQSNYDYNSRGTIPLNSGKWYWEIFMAQAAGCFGVCESPKMPQLDPIAQYPAYFITDDGGSDDASVRAANSATGASITNKSPSGRFGNNKIAMIAYDADDGKLYYGVEGTWQLSADPAAGSNPLVSSISTRYGGAIVPLIGTTSSSATSKVVNFGQDSSFAGNKTAQGNADENGIGDFFYAPPAGFLALCTENLPEPIVDPKNFFNTLTYTGDGSSRSITGVGFKPDFLWIKGTNYTFNHILSDVVRVAGRILYSDTTGAEADYGIASFDSDGWSMSGTMNAINENNRPYVAWCWKAGNANTAFSESGNNPGGTHRANVAAGFSIVSYTGTGAAGTVAHGLGAAPDLMLIKNRDVADAWAVYYGDNTDYLILNTGAATADAATYWNDTSPTSTVFTVNTAHSVNADGEKYIAYCWRSIEGFSKVGSYVGNGANDGPFLNTGFRPAWCLFKGIDGTNSWRIFDNKRDVNNPNNKILYADTTAAEASTSHPLDFVSNGIKIRGQSNDFNENTETHIYMAFAETPIKHSNPK